MWYNVKVKTYPDGHRQYLWSENFILRDVPDDIKIFKRKKIVSLKNREKRLSTNLKRAVQKVYDLARSNEFDWFITLTFSPDVCDRYDFDDCASKIKLLTDRLRKNGNKWIIVPEQHKDGAWHFHGLVQGDLDLTHFRDNIYNVVGYEFGFTTASPIKDKARAATYIAKYLTKDMSVPRGRKCYWASKSLIKPSVDYVDMPDDDFFFNIFAPARFVKEIDGSFGKFVIAEE